MEAPRTPEEAEQAYNDHVDACNGHPLLPQAYFYEDPPEEIPVGLLNISDDGVFYDDWQGDGE